MDYVALLAAIQGLLAATSVWQAERDHKLALAAYEEARTRALESPDIQERALVLRGVLPPHVAEVFKNNIDSCWQRHRDCIDGASDTDTHEACEQINRECICSNLKYMANSNGCLPEDFKELWEVQSCGVKPAIC